MCDKVVRAATFVIIVDLLQISADRQQLAGSRGLGFTRESCPSLLAFSLSRLIASSVFVATKLDLISIYGSLSSSTGRRRS